MRWEGVCQALVFVEAIRSVTPVRDAYKKALDRTMETEKVSPELAAPRKAK